MGGGGGRGARSAVLRGCLWRVLVDVVHEGTGECLWFKRDSLSASGLESSEFVGPTSAMVPTFSLACKLTAFCAQGSARPCDGDLPVGELGGVSPKRLSMSSIVVMGCPTVSPVKSYKKIE